MSARQSVRPMPTNRDEALAILWADNNELRDRIADLEARTGSLPGDYRFEVDGTGAVSIRRVSTDAVDTITTPL